jgi:hypothetical protein
MRISTRRRCRREATTCSTCTEMRMMMWKYAFLFLFSFCVLFRARKCCFTSDDADWYGSNAFAMNGREKSLRFLGLSLVPGLPCFGLLLVWGRFLSFLCFFKVWAMPSGNIRNTRGFKSGVVDWI